MAIFVAINTTNYMEALTVTEYRGNLAASFDRAKRGERVLIRRRKKLYALVCLGKDVGVIIPELQLRIEEAESACREGRCTTCRTKSELVEFLEAL
jgi:hypothetical protein